MMLTLVRSMCSIIPFSLMSSTEEKGGFWKADNSSLYMPYLKQLKLCYNITHSRDCPLLGTTFLLKLPLFLYSSKNFPNSSRWPLKDRMRDFRWAAIHAVLLPQGESCHQHNTIQEGWCIQGKLLVLLTFPWFDGISCLLLVINCTSRHLTTCRHLTWTYITILNYLNLPFH